MVSHFFVEPSRIFSIKSFCPAPFQELAETPTKNVAGAPVLQGMITLIGRCG
jgi:hypothetical protein